MNFLRALLTWDFWFDFPVSTHCSHCEARNCKRLSELASSPPEQWVCGHCGETYVVSPEALNHAMTALFSAYFGY